MTRPVARKTIRKTATATKKQARKQSTPIKQVPKPIQALTRLRKLKQNEEYLIPNAAFVRIVKDALSNAAINLRNDAKYFRIQRAALDALKISAEAYLIQLFEDLTLLVEHAKRKTLMMQDFQLIKRLRASTGDRTMLALRSENQRY
uniref:Histone H2A/H2B/H3 domain-containing protein n=1 Tax=Panagrolaimus superbus TaxID=310955 RepID=A0A914Z886_9BILA